MHSQAAEATPAALPAVPVIRSAHFLAVEAAGRAALSAKLADSRLSHDVAVIKLQALKPYALQLEAEKWALMKQVRFDNVQASG